jgi:UDPglucose 6-dehydrogenase
MSIELCEWLAERGVHVQAHDPAVRSLPADLAGKLSLYPTPQSALKDAEALVVATEWADYLTLDADTVVSSMRNSTVLDPSRFLSKTLGSDPRIRYVTVGKPV